MKHISSISDLTQYAMDKPRFWGGLVEGQLLFPIGSAAISHAIDRATGSILSHVATVVKYRGQWCVFEAIWPHGVVLTPLWRYIDGGEALVLCKRVDPATGREIDMSPALDATVNYLGRDYAALGLVKEGLHLACQALPPEMNDKACYCSGVTKLVNDKTSLPYPWQQGGAPSPEFLFIQPCTVVVATLPKGTQ
jgi:Permuted papain-like amidase enzyme, YaeF/YiiX, C92 family